MFEASSVSPPKVKADLLILPVFSNDDLGPGCSEISEALGIKLVKQLSSAGFAGQLGESLLLSGKAAGSAHKAGVAAAGILFVGLGDRPADDASATDAIRTAAHHAGAAALQAATVASTLPAAGSAPEEDARAFAEGFLLGRYRDDAYKSVIEDPSVTLSKVTALVSGEKAAVTRGLERGRIHAEAANWARDLVTQPSSECTPAALAGVARTIARRGKLEIKVWNRKDLTEGGFGGIIGVSQGGENPPRMIELTYRGAGARSKPIALTGKGITFDSGGLDIKPAKYMEWMKADMAGAAAILAVMRALPLLGLKINVVAAIGCAENLVSGSAQRPGDVITHRGGKTSEVIDTDAEGRLLLADVLSYLSEGKPRAIIDCATLTGTGLGEDVWAIMGTDQQLIDDLRAAGDAAGEPGWQLPLVEAYSRHTDSDTADIKNASWTGADTLASGLFLRFFTNEVPWAHLDVGDTAFLEDERAEWPTGPTGCPARVILRYLEAQAPA